MKKNDIKKTLICWKIYYDRARMYLGMLQSLMIAVVFIETLGIKPTKIQYILLFVLFVLITLIIGYIDTKLGLRSEEMRNNSVQNPIEMEILNLVKEINKKINTESTKNN